MVHCIWKATENQDSSQVPQYPVHNCDHDDGAAASSPGQLSAGAAPWALWQLSAAPDLFGLQHMACDGGPVELTCAPLPCSQMH